MHFVTFAAVVGSTQVQSTQVQLQLQCEQCVTCAAMQNYPFVAPLVRFESPCFHPNVDTAGALACGREQPDTTDACSRGYGISSRW